MYEILGGEGLSNYFAETEVDALKTYDNGEYEVWELEESHFDTIDKMNEEDWKDNWGWWRYRIGSNKGWVNGDVIINNETISAWMPYWWEECNGLESDEAPEFANLLEYFCDGLGASQPRNVTALAVDLAKQNQMKMSELFRKYQGENLLCANVKI